MLEGALSVFLPWHNDEMLSLFEQSLLMFGQQKTEYLNGSIPVPWWGERLFITVAVDVLVRQYSEK